MDSDYSIGYAVRYALRVSAMALLMPTAVTLMVVYMGAHKGVFGWMLLLLFLGTSLAAVFELQRIKLAQAWAVVPNTGYVPVVIHCALFILTIYCLGLALVLSPMSFSALPMVIAIFSGVFSIILTVTLIRILRGAYLPNTTQRRVFESVMVCALLVVIFFLCEIVTTPEGEYMTHVQSIITTLGWILCAIYPGTLCVKLERTLYYTIPRHLLGAAAFVLLNHWVLGQYGDAIYEWALTSQQAGTVASLSVIVVVSLYLAYLVDNSRPQEAEDEPEVEPEEPVPELPEPVRLPSPARTNKPNIPRHFQK